MTEEAALHAGLIVDLIGSQFPELCPVRVAYLGEGYDSTAFDVNGRWVFRFPKRAEIERQLVIETAMLPLLAQGAPLPIPGFCFHGVPSPLFPRRFAGYPMLAGVPGNTLDPVELPFPELAPVLGGFLSFLHGFPGDIARAAGVPERPSRELIEEIRAEALDDLPVLRELAPDAPELRLRDLLEAPLPATHTRVPVAGVIHGDLAAEHILLDPLTSQVTGIIDWSEISLGDPALDFAGLLHWGGRELVSAALLHYRGETDAGFLERARFYAAARGIGDLIFGREMGRPEYLAAGRRALHLSLGA